MTGLKKLQQVLSGNKISVLQITTKECLISLLTDDKADGILLRRVIPNNRPTHPARTMKNSDNHYFYITNNIYIKSRVY